MHKIIVKRRYKDIFTRKINICLVVLFILTFLTLLIMFLSSKSHPNSDAKKPLYLSLENKVLSSAENKTDDLNSDTPNYNFTHTKYTQLPTITDVRVLNYKTNVVTTMNLDEYVALVILAEMPVSFNSEALKAQAIASRTLTVNLILSGSHKDADICTDYHHCQSFISYDDVVKLYGDAGKEAYKKAKNASLATSGIVMLYDGAPIKALFHAASPSATVSSEAVWGGKVDYLVSVPSVETAANTKDYISDYHFTKDEFLMLLTKAGYKSVTKYASKPLSEFVSQPVRNGAATVDYIMIGAEKITGNKFRSALSLRSADFTIGVDGNTVNITTQGYGHGVGMSQNGANILAKKGYNFYDILKYYYTGIYFGFV